MQRGQSGRDRPRSSSDPAVQYRRGPEACGYRTLRVRNTRRNHVKLAVRLAPGIDHGLAHALEADRSGCNKVIERTQYAAAGILVDIPGLHGNRAGLVVCGALDAQPVPIGLEITRLARHRDAGLMLEEQIDHRIGLGGAHRTTRPTEADRAPRVFLRAQRMRGDQQQQPAACQAGEPCAAPCECGHGFLPVGVTVAADPRKAERITQSRSSETA